MRTVQYTEESFAAVLSMVAQSWAWLAVKNAGAETQVDSPYSSSPRMYVRKHKARDNQKRATFAKALFAMTGSDLPEPDKSAIIGTYPHPKTGKGLSLFRRAAAREEARRLAERILAQAEVT